MENERYFVREICLEYGGFIFIALGVLMLVGAIRRWKWVMDMTGQHIINPFGFRTLLHDFFGDEGVRVGYIILSIITILGGIGLWFVASR